MQRAGRGAAYAPSWFSTLSRFDDMRHGNRGGSPSAGDMRHPSGTGMRLSAICDKTRPLNRGICRKTPILHERSLQHVTSRRYATRLARQHVVHRRIATKEVRMPMKQGTLRNACGETGRCRAVARQDAIGEAADVTQASRRSSKPCTCSRLPMTRSRPRGDGHLDHTALAEAGARNKKMPPGSDPRTRGEAGSDAGRHLVQAFTQKP